jgi:hypothetical protein
MAVKRRHFKHNTSFRDRLRVWAERVRKQADLLPPGPEQGIAPAKTALRGLMEDEDIGV